MRPRTKKIILGFALIPLALFIGSCLYYQHLFNTYVDHSVAAYIGNKNYIIVDQKHADEFWYCKASISESTADALLKKYPFHPGFSQASLAGRITEPLITDCPGCWSYMDDKGLGVFDYKLYIVSPDKKQLIMYELFG